MDMNDIFNENNIYEVLTPDGWCDFNGISKNNKETINIKFDDNTELDATKEHKFFIDNKEVKVKNLCVGDVLDTTNSFKKIESIKINARKSNVYDLIEVDNENHQYIVSDCIITRNCDELAYVHPNIAKEFWTSISPTLSTGGRAIITSTPNSDEDLFANLWYGANKTEDDYGNQTDLGINGYKAFKAIWNEHPDRDDDWAKRELGELGEEKFAREHECKFVINDETLIDPLFLTNMHGKDPTNLLGRVRWYKEPKPGMFFTIALDPSLGTGGDPAAIQVFEANTTTQIAEWKHNRTPIPDQIRKMVDVLKYIEEKTYNKNNIYYSIENNSIGEAALISLDEYGEHNIPGTMLSQPKIAGSERRYRKGFNTTRKNKLETCSKLKSLIETNRMEINSKSLISEFKNFVATTTGGFAAKPGETDDLVMATVLSVRMMQQLKTYHKELDKQISDYVDDECIEPMPFIAMF